MDPKVSVNINNQSINQTFISGSKAHKHTTKHTHTNYKVQLQTRKLSIN